MMTSQPLPLILDVDTGIDDAVALALAVQSPEIELLAVTTVNGNVDVIQTTDNTRRVLSWLGASSVPVHRGASRPLAKPLKDAAHVHGSSGLGKAEFPEGSNPVGKDRGPAAIIRLANERPGEITLVCVGPLTNLAIALNVEPSLARLLRRVVVMGGVFFNRGNVTPHAEFNIYADPEAAVQVFESSFGELDLVSLDASHQALLSRELWEAAGKRESAAAQVVARVYAASFAPGGRSDTYLHDPLTLAVAIDPSLASFVTGTPKVQLDGEQRGRTTLVERGAGARVADRIDVERFMRLLDHRLDLRL